jgi:hypothetical protein
VRRGIFRIRCQQYAGPRSVSALSLDLNLFNVHVHRFRETCMTLPAVQALRFLQAEVAEVADHASEEGEVLRELLAPLIGRSAPSAISMDSSGAVSPETFRARREVFQQLMEFFPQEAKEPSADLVEVIDWYEEGVVD